MDGMLIIKIYGSDTNIEIDDRTAQYPLESAVMALSDVVSFDLDVSGVFASLDFQTDKQSYWNGSELHINHIKNAFKPEGVPKAYPEENTSIESFFGSKPLKKMYKWLQISDYRLRPEGLPTGGVIAVNVTDGRFSDNGDGTKTIGFDFVERT